MNAFWAWLRRAWNAFTRTPPQRTWPDDVCDDERLTRYVYKKKYCGKPIAFMPEVYKGRAETSVLRTQGFPDAAVWASGRDLRPRETLHCRADIQASEVAGAKLRVAPDRPPANHAVIIDWPAKEERMSLAQLLASRAAYSPAP